ncbi:hypothetical protein NHX12_008665 [Muraenolepis orangiensis]|uniref:Chordin n=1 Tax=Muraenolepis orangiensis TaxID=630683 RepID=A0A9Q0DN98_9TELE|nr:hypothetical protein NHX12_008665 [Muraenolepis orangiensis]
MRPLCAQEEPRSSPDDHGAGQQQRWPAIEDQGEEEENHQEENHQEENHLEENHQEENHQEENHQEEAVRSSSGCPSCSHRGPGVALLPPPRSHALCARRMSAGCTGRASVVGRRPSAAAVCLPRDPPPRDPPPGTPPGTRRVVGGRGQFSTGSVDGAVELQEEEMEQSVLVNVNLPFQPAALDSWSTPPDLRLSRSAWVSPTRRTACRPRGQGGTASPGPPRVPEDGPWVTGDVVLARGRYYQEVDVCGVTSSDGARGWGLERCGLYFWTVYDGGTERLEAVPPCLKTVGVFLNAGGGCLSFHNPLTRELLASLPTPACGGVPFRSVRAVVRRFEELAEGEAEPRLASSSSSYLEVRSPPSCSRHDPTGACEGLAPRAFLSTGVRRGPAWYEKRPDPMTSTVGTEVNLNRSASVLDPGRPCYKRKASRGARTHGAYHRRTTPRRDSLIIFLLLYRILSPSEREPAPSKGLSGCSFGGWFYSLEDTWHPDLGDPFGVMHCVQCVCEPQKSRRGKVFGKVNCKNIKQDCPETHCDHPVLLPGYCCKTCSKGQGPERQYFHEKGKEKEDDLHKSYNDRSYLSSEDTGPAESRTDFVALLTGVTESWPPSSNGVARARFSLTRTSLAFSLTYQRMGRPSKVVFLDSDGATAFEYKVPKSQSDMICGVWKNLAKPLLRQLQNEQMRVTMATSAGQRVEVEETFSSTLTSEEPNQGMGGIAMLTLSDTENNLHFILILQGLLTRTGPGLCGGSDGPEQPGALLAVPGPARDRRGNGGTGPADNIGLHHRQEVM